MLFDLDGTILDTTDLILRSFAHAFRTGLGEEVTRDELMVHFGRPLAAQFRTMRPHLSAPAVDRLVSVYRQHNEAEHDDCVTVVPGADTCLAALKAAGHRLGIVTSKRLDMTRHGLELFGLDDLFDVIVHSGSTVRHKPDPEPVQHALHLMGAEPSGAAYVGDSPYDMRSGRSAGVRTLGLVHNTFTADELKDAGADMVVSGWSSVATVLLRWAEPCEPISKSNEVGER